MRIVVLGLSITSSWGNGHATNYRALCSALRERGHDVLFLERDQPWYARARDFDAAWVGLYDSVDELVRWQEDVRRAELVLVGSFLPDGVAVAEWALELAAGVVAFWDIDTPVTAAKLSRGDHEYLTPELVPRFDLYLSFTGGPFLAALGASRPRPFYCLVDPLRYVRVPMEPRWDLGYLGTYSEDRQPTLDELLDRPARRLPDARFAVAGPMYPEEIAWPANVERIENVAPGDHPAFYSAQRFTLNVTRADMVRAGWSPSVRLFEAAACAVPVVSDWWEGLDAFFEPGREILIAHDGDDVERFLTEITEDERRAIGERARARVLREHTAARRAAELELFAHFILDVTQVVVRALSVGWWVTQSGAQPVVGTHPRFRQGVDEAGRQRVRSAGAGARLKQDGRCALANAAVMHRTTRSQDQVAFLRLERIRRGRGIGARGLRLRLPGGFITAARQGER